MQRMSTDWIYLDNNATTQPLDEVAAAMTEVNTTLWANPSSVHRFGQMVRQRVELARAQVAKLINCRDRELIFTSGGTESNNLALRGSIEAAVAGNADHDAKPVIITTPIEHSAIREPAEALGKAGAEVVELPVDIDGRIDPKALAEALANRASSGAVCVVSIQWANNETGVIQPMSELVEAVQQFRAEQREADSTPKVLLHSDATQAVGKLPVDAKAMGLDMMTFAAHKFHGPKGVGALFVRSGVRVRPQTRGGPQERERRGGTENTAGIIGMGVAAEAAAAFVADSSKPDAVRQLRDRFEKGVLESCPGAEVNGVRSGQGERLWNTSNIAFPRLEAEAILLGLSEKGVCASAGAACSSGSLEPSPVLLAMGIDEPLAHGSVRFSLSRFTTEDEIDRALAIVPEVIERLARTLPV